MGLGVQELALQLVRQAGDQPELKEKGLALLQRWTDGEDKELAFWGRKGLAALIADRRDYVAAAAACGASVTRRAPRGGWRARFLFGGVIRML